MRITFVCPHLRPTDALRTILTYADRLAARRHDVTVLVPARRPLLAWWRNRRDGAPGWMPGCRARVQWTPDLSPESLPSGDAIVATAWPIAWAVAAAPARCGQRVHLIQEYESARSGRPDRVEAAYRLPLTPIVVSSWLRDLLRERVGAEAEVLVTPVAPDLVRHAPARQESPSTLRVLMRHAPEEGLADGLEAVALVRRAVPALRLVGFGARRPGRRAAYDEFHVAPARERQAALYARADIYLCPSWAEGLGVPAMEAMACGAALLTYDNGGCREYARDGETALVARCRDVSDLTARLERLARDAPLRARLAAAGRAHVTTAFDWGRAVERLETLLGATRWASGPGGAHPGA